jgi:hypothetical protein
MVERDEALMALRCLARWGWPWSPTRAAGRGGGQQGAAGVGSVEDGRRWMGAPFLVLCGIV